MERRVKWQKQLRKIQFCCYGQNENTFGFNERKKTSSKSTLTHTHKDEHEEEKKADALRPSNVRP